LQTEYLSEKLEAVREGRREGNFRRYRQRKEDNIKVYLE
jgi:hypothetical protein